MKNLIIVTIAIMGGCAQAVNPLYQSNLDARNSSDSFTEDTSNNDQIISHTTWCNCIDRDGDGLGDSRVGTNSVIVPIGFVHNCADQNDLITDGCNTGQENGCQWFCVDEDRDGFGGRERMKLAVHQPIGFVPMINGQCTDCIDTDPLINPSAIETCSNLFDVNCDNVLNSQMPICNDR